MALSLGLSSIVHHPPTKIRVFSDAYILQPTFGKKRVVSYRSPICAHSQSLQSFERRTANYKPTIWHDDFIQSIEIGEEQGSGTKERVCKLKKEVSQILNKQELLGDKLELVDALQQLGVAYHFQEEINCVITEIHESMDQILLTDMQDNLHVVSLLFRLLRMHGFSVKEDILKKYLDKEGYSKAMLSSDIKGILSLYEASYFAKEGEETLEMARHLATKYLTEFLASSNFDDLRLKEHVAHALELPLNWRMERLHTHWFINQYNTDEQMIPPLWELAVLDFNILQKSYKRELKQVSRWWTSLNLYEKLPFFRDRLAENYLWSVGWAFEPEHSNYRIAQTQANCLITTIDDIYDVYGSLNELEAFTDAIEKWDITASEVLPEYMQICISALFNTVDDQGSEVFKRKGLNVIPYLRRAWKDLCKAYLKEARWYHSGYVPTLEEYLENAWVSISGNIALSNAYCINNYITAKELEKFSSGYPDIVQYSSMNLRLYDDLATSSDELDRGDVSKSVQCYMNDKGVTEFIARKDIKEMIWKYWTLINVQGEIIGNSDFEKYFKKVAFNVPRMAQCIYQHGDGYGNPDCETKDQINSLLFDPINLI
ncbi:Terpene synthase [Rhynchospora pubera]|uniref:Terpene synthase n=1 Tax=Rhynchospora pubera TaxID=906938 RepID=A0AAV8HAT5_9POAL|nr:Terpene synthase [Rhynchospora pubera]KAJ4814970.1 Terpene synthase [Rhynchospora pubera]